MFEDGHEKQLCDNMIQLYDPSRDSFLKGQRFGGVFVSYYRCTLGKIYKTVQQMHCDMTMNVVKAKGHLHCMHYVDNTVRVSYE